MLLILYTLAFVLQFRVTIVITIITFENTLASIFHIYTFSALFTTNAFQAACNVNYSLYLIYLRPQ